MLKAMRKTFLGIPWGQNKDNQGDLYDKYFRDRPYEETSLSGGGSMKGKESWWLWETSGTYNLQLEGEARTQVKKQGSVLIPQVHVGLGPKGNHPTVPGLGLKDSLQDACCQENRMVPFW